MVVHRIVELEAAGFPLPQQRERSHRLRHRPDAKHRVEAHLSFGRRDAAQHGVGQPVACHDSEREAGERVVGEDVVDDRGGIAHVRSDPRGTVYIVFEGHSGR